MKEVTNYFNSVVTSAVIATSTFGWLLYYTGHMKFVWFSDTMLIINFR